MIVDIQFNPTVEPWESIRDGVLVAEEAGFGTAWVFDHFDGAMLGGTTMLECFTLLGAMAASTTTIGLGTLVANVSNRNPGVLAMCAASVQAISNGRFTLGLGAGAAPNTRWSTEHGHLGIALAATMDERHQLLDAALTEIDQWWNPDRQAELTTFALPSPRPPVIVGVNSEPLAALAGRRTDGINVRSDHPRFDALVVAANEARAHTDRAGTTMDVSVWAAWDDALADPEHPHRRRWAALGVTRLVMVCLPKHDPAAIARFLR